MKRRMKRILRIWVCNNLAQSIQSSLPHLDGFIEEESNTQIINPPTVPEINSAQKDVQEVHEYILDLRRCRWQNDAAEGKDCAQQPLLLFMIPVLVSFLFVVILST